MTEYTPLASYEPKLPDDFLHFSETTEIIFRDESSDAVPSYLFDAELDDETIGRALSSPLFIQEREEPADRRQAYHSHEEILLPAQSFSVCHSRMGRLVHELSSFQKRKSSREMENERIRILFEKQKKIDHTLACDERRLNELIFNRTLQGDDEFRRDQQLLHERFLKQKCDLR